MSIIAQIPFGFGFVLVYISVQEYLADAYTLYAASVLAANTIFRSAFGAVFPLFTNVRNWDIPFVNAVTDSYKMKYMYQNPGDHWASSVPAFLALGCVPFPILFYHYGSRIRANCQYAAKAALDLNEMKDAV